MGAGGDPQNHVHPRLREASNQIEELNRQGAKLKRRKKRREGFRKG
jgi:hypothetical protein